MTSKFATILFFCCCSQAYAGALAVQGGLGKTGPVLIGPAAVQTGLTLGWGALPGGITPALTGSLAGASQLTTPIQPQVSVLPVASGLSTPLVYQATRGAASASERQKYLQHRRKEAEEQRRISQNTDVGGVLWVVSQEHENSARRRDEEARRARELEAKHPELRKQNPNSLKNRLKRWLNQPARDDSGIW